MKKFIALAILATTASHAADRNIYDIMYLPKAGTTYGFTDFSYGEGEIKSDDDGDEDIDGYIISQIIGHSFTDRLSLNLSLNYANITSNPEDGKEHDFSKGISDPTLSARFRIMDEALQLDFLGGATISLADKETDVNSTFDKSDYDNLQGGNSFFVGTQFGAKSENFQWALTGLFTHKFKAENEYKVAGIGDFTIKEDAHNELNLRGDILIKLAEKSFLRSFISVDFVESFDDDQEPANKFASMTTYTIGTQYQHLLSQDLLLKAGVDYATINARSGQVDDNKTWTYTIGANYQF